jgi:hypothetical protein
VNHFQRSALGIWILWVGFILLFPNWQQAAERETDYRKELGVHFVLKPPSAVAVPCYFVGCLTAPASYFHVLVDRKLFYPELACVTVLMILALLLFRTRKNRSGPVCNRGERVITSALIALALPVPLTPYFPLGILAGYLPAAVLHPDHDHASVLVGFPFLFVLYAAPTYFLIWLTLWARTRFRSER